MNELEELLKAQPFTAFTVTTSDGYSIPVPSAGRALLGVNMLVVTDDSGYLHHLPLEGIARITEYNPSGKGKERHSKKNG